MLERIVIISLMIYSVKYMMEDGQLLDWLAKFLSRFAKPESKLSKPLYGCVLCMSSAWGVILQLSFDATTGGGIHASTEYAFTVAFTCLGCVGMSGIIHYFFEHLFDGKPPR
jgi:hypothetical protein